MPEEIKTGLPEAVYLIQFKIPELNISWRSSGTVYLTQDEADSVIVSIKKSEKESPPSCFTEWRVVILPCLPERACLPERPFLEPAAELVHVESADWSTDPEPTGEG